MLYLGKENRCLHAICHSFIAIHSLSIDQLLNGWLAELLAHLLAANTTSTPIEVEDGGGEEPQSDGLILCVN